VTACDCKNQHQGRRVVLTGGPGAGKTAVLELVKHYFCKHVDVLPESASLLFGGGFPRGKSVGARAAAQRAIFHVQRELEAVAEVEGNPAITLCDRGTVDGRAYWPGPDDFWHGVGTGRLEEFRRYEAVIHLRTPPPDEGYNHENPVRIESPAEAAAIDARILEAWEGHPRRFIIESTPSFLDKARAAIEVLRGELPSCCRSQIVPALVK
jgi:hypothetical protein